VEWVGLTEAVQALRDELAVARKTSEGEPIMFSVGPVEVEFAVVAKKTGTGKAGLTFGVVTIGAEGGLAREQTHRVKVTLTPRDVETGREPEISNQVHEVPKR